jgi:hypothetical protein
MDEALGSLRSPACAAQHGVEGSALERGRTSSINDDSVGMCGGHLT